MSLVAYSAEGAVGTILLNRPEALNALNSSVLEEFNAILDKVNLSVIRCLIVSGSGEKAFAAGADIGEMYSLSEEEGNAFSKKGNDLFRRIETFPIPIIAAVNGYALGGGCELAMACDFRIASENAVFGQPETGLGITPGFGGTQRLARLVGAGYAKQMIYTARNIKAEEALRIGLVNKVAAPGDLMKEAKKLALQIAANAPIAVRYAKADINEGLELPMEQAIRVEEQRFGTCFATQDQKEGMGAFLEKRKEKTFKNN